MTLLEVFFFPLTKLSQHCTVDSSAAVIKQTQIQFSACFILPVCVVINQKASGAGERTRWPQCMLQDGRV